MRVSMTATTLGQRGFVSRDVARLKWQSPRYRPNRDEVMIDNVLSRRYLASSISSSSLAVDILRIVNNELPKWSRTFSSARAPISADSIAEALTKQQVKELAVKLTSNERELFLAALNECKSAEEKASYEGRWATVTNCSFIEPGINFSAISRLACDKLYCIEIH